MKRRVLSLILCVAMAAIMLVGCGGAKEPASNTEETGTQAASSEIGKGSKSEDEAITVGVSLLNNAHVFYNNIEAALKEEASKTNIELIIQDAAGDSNKQLNQVQDFITQKVDAIVLCPTNSAGSKSMVELAEKAGIPVFTMDVQSDGEVVTHVATDNYKGGQLAGEYMVNNVLPDKKGDVAVITYSEIEGCVDREKGFTEWIEKNAPDVKVVDVQNYAGDQGKAADVMQNMLLKHADLKGVFCVGDPAAVGAISSIDAVKGDVKVIGFDGNPEGIEAILSGGNWVADIAQDPASIGTKTLQAVRTYLAGSDVEKLIPISPTVIDASNAK